MATAEAAAREPGSVMHIEGTELRTTCGHSFASCHVFRCFRLPLAIMAERDRAFTAARVEHEKSVAREAARFMAELNGIEATYRELAARQPS